MSTATAVPGNLGESSPSQTQPEPKFWRSKSSPNEYTLMGCCKDRRVVQFSVEGQGAPIVGIPNDLHWFSGGHFDMNSSMFLTCSIVPFCSSYYLDELYPEVPREQYGCCLDLAARRATIFSHPHPAILPLHLIAFDYLYDLRFKVRGYSEPIVSFHLGKSKEEASVQGLSAALAVVLGRNFISSLDFSKAMVEFFPASFWASTFWHFLWLTAVDPAHSINLWRGSLVQAFGWECLVRLLAATAQWQPDKIEPLPEDALWSNIPTSTPPLPPPGDGSFTWLKTAQFYRAALDLAQREIH